MTRCSTCAAAKRAADKFATQSRSGSQAIVLPSSTGGSGLPVLPARVNFRQVENADCHGFVIPPGILSFDVTHVTPPALNLEIVLFGHSLVRLICATMPAIGVRLNASPRVTQSSYAGKRR